MRANAGIIILMGLVLIIGTVSAEMADSGTTISSSKEWVIAQPMDTSTITLVVRNSTPHDTPVPGAQVTFTIENNAEIQGSMVPNYVTTDSNGVATSTFVSGRKSGTAIIKASILSDDGGIPHTYDKTLDQKVDHYIPQYAFFDTPEKLPVGTVDNLNITVLDMWGNRIDNKGPSPAEVHTITIYMPGGKGRGLWDGSNYTDKIQVTTDAFGNASARYRIADTAESNWIYMDTIGNMVYPPDTWIQGVSLDGPCYIMQVHPSPDDIAADAVAKFGLYYYVYDRYMNPVNNTPVRITASDGSTFEDVTGSLGSYFVTFGPKDTASVYNLTMIALDNTSALCLSTGETGDCKQSLTFHNTEPTDLIATANPQGMASLDVDPSSRGSVLAKVVDIKGNSVIGETVHFSMGTPTYPGGPYNETSPPTLTPASAMTATGGYATATFTPGAFATSATPDSYNATATGMVTVTATWVDRDNITQSQDVSFIWKNYPYLSVTIPKDTCDKVKVGDQINISVSLFGDGAALKPKPIDVMLVNDRSGSMLQDNPDRMVSLMDAAILFNSQMDDSRDRVGLVSFGDPWSTSGWSDLTGATSHPYGTAWPGDDYKESDDNAYVAAHYPGSPKEYGTAQYAFVDLPLTANPVTNAATVNAAINGMVPSGGTPTREGMYRAIQHIIDNKRSTAVSAIILLTDGDYNTGGAPGGGSGVTSFGTVGTGSVITYAEVNNITIYTIGLGSSVKTAELTSYATQTGGKYYPAPSPSDLAGIYTQIAGDLQETAGGNTQVTMDYGTVNINGVTGGDIREYMDYVPLKNTPLQESDSTFVKKSNITKDGVTNVHYTQWRNDAANWTARNMAFDVGEIKLNETWATNFRVNLTKAGKITLFGPSNPASKICFTDASTGTTTCQIIEEWKCSIRESIVNIPFGNKTLLIDNLTATSDGPDPNILTIRWNTTYTGGEDGATAQETVSYKNTEITTPTQHYVTVPGGLLFESNCFEKTNYLTVDTTTWTPGWYSLQVFGQAVDAKNPGAAEVAWEKKGQDIQKYIKLE